MSDLYEQLEQRSDQLERERQKAEKLEDILLRPDGDFFVFADGEIGLRSYMRPKRLPRLIWIIWKAILRLFLKPLYTGS